MFCLLDFGGVFETMMVTQNIESDAEYLDSNLWMDVPQKARESDLFPIESSEQRKILEQLENYAKSSTMNIFLAGGVGIGKNYYAKKVYEMSRRPGKWVVVNCPALDDHLWAVELFGCEEGAFTGANERKIGKLELADQGVCFCDEIGDIPLSIQPRLLNFLSEGSFTRVGGTKLIKVDVKLVFATNKNLQEMVKNLTFRADLYSRVKAGRIYLPSLSQQKEMIPHLVFDFIHYYADAEKKKIRRIEKSAMKVLVDFRWEYEARDLKEAVQYAVVNTKKNVIAFGDLSEEIRMAPARNNSEISFGKEVDDFLVKYSVQEIQDIATRKKMEISLRRCKNKMILAAQECGMSYSGFRNKWKELQRLKYGFSAGEVPA